MCKLLSLCMIVSTGLIFQGCASGGNVSANSLPGQNVITINNSGDIPIFESSQTSSEIYVHNNSNELVKGISYSAKLNINGKFVQDTSEFLDKDSLEQCASIAANQSCQLRFTTPKLNDLRQVTALVNLVYHVNNHVVNFSQTFNFKGVSIASAPEFASGVSLSSFGWNTGYGTIYIYGDKKTFNNVEVNSDKFALRVKKGTVNWVRQPYGIWVQAIEVTALLTNKSFATDLTLTSNKISRAKTVVLVNPVASGGILVSSQVPVVNTANTSTPSASLILINAGNASLTLGSSSATSGITNLTGCSSGQNLNVGESCSMDFNLTQSNGSGYITVNYTGAVSNSISQAVIWYNSQNNALLSMDYNSSVAFSPSSTTLVNVTLTNIGGYNLTNIFPETPSAINGANATVTISYPSINSCQNATLNVGASCSFILNLSDSVIESNKQILFSVLGSYNNGEAQTYSRSGVLTYSVVPNTYVYATNSNSSNLSAYSLNPSSGRLTQISGSPVASGDEPIASAMSPDSKYLYVSNYQSSNIWVYSIDSNSGVLSHIGSYEAIGGPDTALLITPNGKFLYVGTWEGNILYAYSINDSTGALSLVGSYNLGSQVEAIVMNSTGAYLYAITVGQEIFSYKINQSTGQLSANGNLGTGYYPQAMAMDSTNNYIYVVNYYDFTINVFAINQSSGVLSAAGTFPTTTNPDDIIISPNAKFMYVTGGGNSISGYAINSSSGAVTSLGSFYAGGGHPISMAITPDNQYLYTGTQTNNNAVVSFNIESTGVLAQIGAYPSGYTPYVTLDTVNGFLYTANGGGSNISVFSMNSTNGVLNQVTGSPFAAGSSPNSIQLFYAQP